MKTELKITEEILKRIKNELGRKEEFLNEKQEEIIIYEIDFYLSNLFLI